MKTKRSYIPYLFLLLIMGAALHNATAEVVYSRLDKLKHLERIALTLTGSDNSAKLQVPVNEETASNLIDGNSITSWNSRVAAAENLFHEVNYPNGSSLTGIIDGKGGTPTVTNSMLTVNTGTLGSFYILKDLDFKTHSSNNSAYSIELDCSAPGKIGFRIGTESGGIIKTTDVELDQSGGVTLDENGFINVTTGKHKYRARFPACNELSALYIDAPDYSGNIDVYSITDVTVNDVTVGELTMDSYSGKNADNYKAGENTTGNLVIDKDRISVSPAEFHFKLCNNLNMDEDKNYKVVMKVRGDHNENTNKIRLTINNVSSEATGFLVSDDWMEVTIENLKVIKSEGWGVDRDWLSIWSNKYKGRLDIEWLRLYEINQSGTGVTSSEEKSESIANEDFSKDATSYNSQKLKDYDPSFDSGIMTMPDNVGWHQFAIVKNLNIKRGSNYKVELWLKADTEGTANLCIGNDSGWDDYTKGTRSVQYGRAWSKQTVLFESTDVIGNPENCEIRFQAGGSKASFQFRSIRIMEIPDGGGMKEIINYDLTNGWPYSNQWMIGPSVTDGVASFERNNNYMLFQNFSMEKGRTYTIRAKMQCIGAVEGQVLDLTGTSCVCLGWDGTPIGYFDQPLKYGEDWKEVNIVINPSNYTTKGDIRFNTWTGFNGMTLLMKDLQLISNTEDKENEYFLFSEIDDNTINNSGFNNDYASIDYVEGERLLYVPCVMGFKALDKVNLEDRSNYRVKVTLKTANDGNFTIKLGNDKSQQSVTVPVKATENFTEIEAEIYNPSSISDGYCIVARETDLTANVEIDKVELYRIQPEVTSSTPTGYDYFDIELPTAINGGDIYYLNVVRQCNAALLPTGASPLRFRVAALSKSGNETSLGQFAIGGYYDMDYTMQKESDFDKNSKKNQFVRVEVPNDGYFGDKRTLRFYCTRNSNNETAVCAIVNAVRVPIIELNELSLYKLTGWKNTEAQSNATWVMPIISRFQIEANALRGNYPGETIKQSVDGYSNSRYTSHGATLFDGDPSTFWKVSDNKSNNSNYCVDLLLPPMNTVSDGKKSISTVIKEYRDADLQLNEKINLVVHFSRPRDINQRFPLKIRYCGNDTDDPSFTPTEWKTITLPLINGEEEILFSLEVDPKWRRVRIECEEALENNSTIPTDNKDFSLAELRAYIEFPKIDLDEFAYDVLYNDRLFAYDKDDIGSELLKNYNLESFKWEHTQGIVDDINNPVPYENRIGEVSDGDKWANGWSSMVNNLNSFSIGSSSIPLAKFDYVSLDNPDDSDGLNTIESRKLIGNRQRTYVVNHDIYTLPGKRVDLYPYSDIHSTAYYEDQFVRWYDYVTDGTPQNLYFFTDPKSVIKTEKFGFYGSNVLLDAINRGPGTVGSVYFGKKNNSLDYEIEDQWIAADFSICLVDSNFVHPFTDRVNKNSKTIKEPPITFRHLFHIRDGRKFAEEFSGSYEKNVLYNKKNRKYISARAKADFTIRLDNAMPLGSAYQETDGGNDNTKSSYFYKRNGNGGDEYVRVCSYDIRAYRIDDDFTSKIAGITTDNYRSGEVMFEPYDRSFYTNVGAIISSTLEDSDEGVNWVPNNRGFARAIYCPGEKAVEGKYLVRLYGLDKDGEIITIYGTGNKPLVLAEYEVTFLPEEQASFVPEHRLKKLKPSDVLYTHTEDYLESTYNSGGKARKAVNFDKFSIYNLKKGISEGLLTISEADLSKIIYSQPPLQLTVTEGLYTGSTSDEFNEIPVDGTQIGNYLKMPLDWTVSNYGFGFDKPGDYNIYRLADHSSATVYKSAATRRTASSNPADATNGNLRQGGVYDRLFYNSGGQEKGMFYYVNAASDPGDIVEITIDDPCPGATLYASGWVNEFNDHQRETANVIVNYYANITEDKNADGSVDKKGKITRRVQMKGFETGYVPNHSNEMDQVFDEGKQGDWMHFYFSFVPNIQRVKETLNANEEILNYSLILENNAISSWGADYAIDDIRAYVAPPRVEAYQTKPVCDSRNTKENLQIEVRLPYDALLESFGIVEPEEENENGTERYVALQYAILDKEQYETAYKDVLNSYTDPENHELDIMREAFVKSVLTYPHIHIDSDAEQDNKTKPIPWGTIYFNTFYDGNLIWDKANYSGDPYPAQGVPANRAMKHDEDEERNISFITTPPMKPEKRDFIIVIGQFENAGLFAIGQNNVNSYTDNNDNKKKLAEAFDFGSGCCRMAEFSLSLAAQKVVDGILYGDDDQITCCENQRPVVQMNLYRNDKEGNIYDKDDETKAILWENPYLDWYYGTYEQFMDEEMNNEAKTSLWEVLASFRTDYPTSTTWDVPASDDLDDDGNQISTGRTDADGKPIYPVSYTSSMKTYLKDLYENGKLQLYQASYVFPNLVIGEENGKKKLSEDYFVTAIPIDSNDALTIDEYIVCLEPSEIKITVSNTSPKMNNGFASGIDYPESMDIVPLRLGLKHTDSSSVDAGEWTPATNTQLKDEIVLNVSEYEGKETLVMPLRNLAVATTGVNKFNVVEGDPFCYLVETNDPSYRKLGQVAFFSRPMASEGNEDISTQADEGTSGLYDSDFGLIPRGFISVDAQNTPGYFSNIKITFNKDDMQFHEGYYYTFKFAYEEDYTGVTLPEGVDAESMPCHGETFFTIKVVPEYQQWTGEASLNWNNDENWRRVSKDDLLIASGEAPSGKSDSSFTVNDANPNTFSYAPLDFTKVIIPAGASYPQLAARLHDRTSTSGTLSISNGHGDAVGYVWANGDPKATTAAGADKESSSVGETANVSYHPTLNIQYDMAAATYEGTDNVYCRPWYANACEQIHFNSNAEILNQHNLDYQKAWVDMEMKPYLWYNVASPLQGVVAGDMYLPKADARQSTELFTDIDFNTDINDRFQPAVYQRGWDKGSEKVYNIENTTENSGGKPVCPEEETVAIKSTWSHVYNDVAETYTPGMGFSVKTDVSRFETENESFDGLVKFRFPKADMSYYYFKDDNSTKANEKYLRSIKEVKEGKEGKLFELTQENGTAQTVLLKRENRGYLFLAGNPFMAHLDMAKFLEVNSEKIESKFWILSEGEGQVGVVLDRNGEEELITNMTAAGNISNADYSQLPPMQGFFVQAKDEDKTEELTIQSSGMPESSKAKDEDTTKELTITFTPDMMAVKPYVESEHDKGLLLKAPARGTRADDYDIIRVSTGGSSAIIRLDENAEKGYAASEDVEMIDDSNQRGLRRLYTVAGNMASAINQTPDADGVEVGLMAPADSVTTVVFNGDALENYLLLDMESGEMTQLYDGYEVKMTGAVSGRYFLTLGLDTSDIEDGSIRIEPQGDEIVVTAAAACGDMTVRVYDTLGREVAKAEGFGQETRIRVSQGIYVVDARGAERGRRSAKISIK